MDNGRGVFIVLEGVDGSGKGTQFRLLSERLRAVGYDMHLVDTPRYNEPSSYFVKQYLQGAYGPTQNISPYASSLFFALDRYEAASEIRKALDEGKVVLANRYTGSSMAHLGGKFGSSGEQRGFFVWLDGLEFQMLNIPRPNISLVLKVPPQISNQLLSTRSITTGIKKDEHEKDEQHIEEAARTYDILCKLFPKDFKPIECAKDGKLLSIPEINNLLWDEIKPLLPEKPHNSGHEVVVDLSSQQSEAKNEDITNKDQLEESSFRENRITIEIPKISLLAADFLKGFTKANTEILSLSWPSTGKNSYYTHPNLPKAINYIYKDSVEKLSSLYVQLLEALSSRSSRQDIFNVIPMATLCSLKVEAEPSVIKKMIISLKYQPQDELRWLAEQLLSAASMLRPNEFTDIEGGMHAYEEFINIPGPSDKQDNLERSNKEQVTIIDALPKNEFSVLEDIMFAFNHLSRNDIRQQLDQLSYNQKVKILSQSTRPPVNPVLENVIYRWNVVAERSDFYKTMQFLEIDQIQAQQLSINYGFSVPKKIKDAGLEVIYRSCFEESQKLYDSFKQENLERFAPYCTLYGHKNMWQFTSSAFSLIRASDSNNLTIARMKKALAEVHPVIGDVINKPESKAGALKPQPDSSPPKPLRTRDRARRKRLRKPKKD